MTASGRAVASDGEREGGRFAAGGLSHLAVSGVNLLTLSRRMGTSLAMIAIDSELVTSRLAGAKDASVVAVRDDDADQAPVLVVDDAPIYDSSSS